MKSSLPLTLLSILLIASSDLLGQSTQTVRGTIRDEMTKEPLIGVTVLITTIDPPKGSSTDTDGNFRIDDVPVGRHNIRVSYVGYEGIEAPNVVVTAGKEVILNLGITENITSLEEVVVTADLKEDKTATNNDLAVVSARSFNIDDTKRYAGSLGDPSRMAANFAGVIGGNDSRNDIVVRGNSPLGMLWQLEGLNIPNPNHFGALSSTGGPVSMLNNNNLDKSDFMTSAFPAQYGNATAGVFDLRLRDGNNEQTEFMVQTGFNGFEAGAEGPFTKNSKASYIANYRFSTLGVFKALGIEFGTGSNIPEYQDLNFKISIPTDKRNGKWTIFGLGGVSAINLEGSKADLSGDNTNLYGDENQDAFPKYKTGIAGISYEWNPSQRTFAKLTGGISSTWETYTADSLVRNSQNDVVSRHPISEAKFATTKSSLVFYTRTKFDSRNSLTSGFYIDYLSFNLVNRVINPIANEDFKRVDIRDNTVLYQAHTAWKHRFTENFSFMAGLHGQYYSLNGQTALEPRGSVKYQFNFKHALSAGMGLHNQVQSIYSSYVQTQTPTGIEYTNKNLKFTTSKHFVLTYDWNMTEQVRMKLESYYQMLTNVPVEFNPSSFSTVNQGASFAPQNEAHLVNSGTGTNYGTELTLERFFSKGYYFLVTGSLFSSTYKGSDGVERNTGYNTKYAANVLAGKEWRVGRKKNFFSLNMKMTTIGGKYLTPIDFMASQQAGYAVYQDALAFTDKQDPYFRFDLRLSFRREYRHSTMDIALDLQNLTNHKNIFFQSYNPRINALVTQYQMAFFPIPYVRYTF